jgi:sugar/nucleoside kinase (ribokinase family)
MNFYLPFREGKGAEEIHFDLLSQIISNSGVTPVMATGGRCINSFKGFKKSSGLDGTRVIESKAETVSVADTTGAGDLFASGFLYGYLEGYSLEQCAYFGNLLGGTIVGVIGAEIPQSKWDLLRERVSEKGKE